jgi:hypothetical protein
VPFGTTSAHCHANVPYEHVAPLLHTVIVHIHKHYFKAINLWMLCLISTKLKVLIFPSLLLILFKTFHLKHVFIYIHTNFEKSLKSSQFPLPLALRRGDCREPRFRRPLPRIHFMGQVSRYCKNQWIQPSLRQRIHEKVIKISYTQDFFIEHKFARLHATCIQMMVQIKYILSTVHCHFS